MYTTRQPPRRPSSTTSHSLMRDQPAPHLRKQHSPPAGTSTGTTILPRSASDEVGWVDFEDALSATARSEEAATFDRGDPNGDPAYILYEYRALCVATIVNPF